MISVKITKKKKKEVVVMWYVYYFSRQRDKGLFMKVNPWRRLKGEKKTLEKEVYACVCEDVMCVCVGGGEWVWRR